jgi:hypothetical protein
MHEPRGVRKAGVGSGRPVRGRHLVRKIGSTDAGIEAGAIHQGLQLLDGWQPPVGVSSIGGVVEGGKKVLGAVGAANARIAAVGGRIGVAPGIGVVRVMRVGVVLDAVPVPLSLPDQAGDIVPDHGPGSGGFRQGVVRAVQLGVETGRTCVLRILTVQGLALGWTGVQDIAEGIIAGIITCRLPGVRPDGKSRAGIVPGPGLSGTKNCEDQKKLNSKEFHHIDAL